MKYYTYIHKRGDTGEVFYVGKGTGRRAWWKFHQDNKKWCRITQAHGYSIHIVNRWATELEALHDEMDLQHWYQAQGCDLANKHISTSVGRYAKKKPVMNIDPKKWIDLYDIYVDLARYHARLQLMPSGCLEQVSGARHNQGYMMVNAIRKSDGKPLMTTGHRVAGRLKWQRALASTEFVIRTCGNAACHHPDHLKLGNYLTKGQNGLQRGRKYGIDKELVRGDRRYKYSVAELKWMLTQTPWAVAQRYNLRDGAQAQRRAVQCQWLAHFDDVGNLLPAWAHLYPVGYSAV